MRKSKFLALPNYRMIHFTSSHPHFIILYMNIAMLPRVAMVKILENDPSMNSFLVKLQHLSL